MWKIERDYNYPFPPPHSEPNGQFIPDDVNDTLYTEYTQFTQKHMQHHASLYLYVTREVFILRLMLSQFGY